MYQAFGTKPKSIADYQDEFAAQEDKQAARESNRLALMIQKGQYGDQLAQRERGNRLMTLAQGVSDPQELIQRMRQGGFHAEADAALKRQADIGKEKADADRAAQAAEKDRLSNLYTKIDRHTQGLAMVQNPQGLAQWIMEGVSSGVMEQAKADQLLSQPPRNQKEFDALKERLRQGGLTLSQQVEQAWKAKDFGLRVNNELIGPDGTVNQALLGARQSVASAGKSVTNINTGQTGFNNEMKLRDDFKQEPIYKAHQEVQSAYQQIKSALGQKSPAGDLAGATKIMKLLDPGSVVRESELGMAMAASGLMDRIANYAQMTLNGTKLTPTQRKDFQDLADKLHDASVQQFNTKRKDYESLGKDYGLNAGRALGPEASGSKVVDFGSLK